MSEELETEIEPLVETVTQKSTKIARIITWVAGFFVIIVFASVLLGMFIMRLNTAPDNFPTNQSITIHEGANVREITQILADQNVVRSASLLYYQTILFHDPTTLKASTYIFDTPLSSYEVAKRLTEGDFDTDLIRITFIEGERVTHFAARASEVLPSFNEDSFLLLASTSEGTLFPETYFVPMNFTAVELFELLHSVHDETLNQYQEEIDSNKLSEKDIVTLASIVEREANSSTSKRMVAGILLNRLDIGMALQADATIEYILDTPIAELRAGELAEKIDDIDSPYNTYKYPGLPPTPIGNPGLDAIEAVLYPTKTNYLYYITGEDGKFYYAETYNQHLKNVQQHLR